MAKITKVLAANRGEIAIRVFRAAKMLRLETVAIYILVVAILMAFVIA